MKERDLIFIYFIGSYLSIVLDSCVNDIVYLIMVVPNLCTILGVVVGIFHLRRNIPLASRWVCPFSAWGSWVHHVQILLEGEHLGTSRQQRQLIPYFLIIEE